MKGGPTPVIRPHGGKHASGKSATSVVRFAEHVPRGGMTFQEVATCCVEDPTVTHGILSTPFDHMTTPMILSVEMPPAFRLFSRSSSSSHFASPPKSISTLFSSPSLSLPSLNPMLFTPPPRLLLPSAPCNMLCPGSFLRFQCALIIHSGDALFFP